ncbi:MAG TPA: TatD family hydrolase, partial [Thermodesulfobacteriota bacterium]|nr:TatD family hydrolase [Thermodesulfobacteriota bacterium]
MLIDTHAHLEMLQDVTDVIERAKEAGVEGIVTASSDLISSKKSVEIASEFPTVFAAVGIHPHEASGFSEEALSEIEGLSRG